MIDMQTIGDRIKLLRAEMTQQEMARIAGTTKQYVSQLESGRNQVPNSLILDAWARHFRVSLNWLLTGSEARQPSAQESQPVGLDVDRLTDLIETVEAAQIQASRAMPPRMKARIVASLYASNVSRDAVNAALAGILATLED